MENASDWQWLIALIGPGLLVGGIVVGRLMEKTSAAHKRIDRLETTLKEEFQSMKEALTTSIETAYLHCPLAKEGRHERTGS